MVDGTKVPGTCPPGVPAPVIPEYNCFVSDNGVKSGTAVDTTICQGNSATNNYYPPLHITDKAGPGLSGWSASHWDKLGTNAAGVSWERNAVCDMIPTMAPTMAPTSAPTTMAPTQCDILCGDEAAIKTNCNENYDTYCGDNCDEIIAQCMNNTDDPCMISNQLACLGTYGETTPAATTMAPKTPADIHGWGTSSWSCTDDTDCALPGQDTHMKCHLTADTHQNQCGCDATTGWHWNLNDSSLNTCQTAAPT
jgi:hypothetical protein